MLKKDEYNQEDYNDYYRQETEGAELNGPDDEDGGGAINKFIILLILIALAVAGYFGFKMMNPATTDSIDQSLQVSVDNLPQTTQQETQKEETEEVIDTPAQTTQKEVTKVADVTPEKTTEKVEQANETEKDDVTNKVQQAVASSTKMSPEEVASIVTAVMQQMNQEKTTTPDNSVAAKKDVKLINELSSSNVDSVSSDLEKELANVNINENTQIDNSKKQVDVYNKVNVQNVKGEDSLSQLSTQITNEIEDAKVSSTTTTTNEEDKEYSADIKKEVVFRKKEMRIIIVKKGDTLGKLAKRAYGNVMDYKRIYKANPEITRPDRIYIGQKIRIPN